MCKNSYSLIVVGGGHAGIEAATVAARMGLNVLLVTLKLDQLGFMSCNPSIGGLAKGHMVKEIDALGGEMGLAADYSCVQFKRLNARKGPAVRGSRAQCDKSVYTSYFAEKLKKYPNLSLFEGEVRKLLLKKDICIGIELMDGSQIHSKAVVITTGTFMNAVMHIGSKQIGGGRVGDKATIGISDQLRISGFEVKRLKTGTPPRLFKKSINWDLLEPQWGDDEFVPFSFRSANKMRLEKLPCYLSHTNEKTHDVIRRNLDKSPMFTGAIEGLGPRYCPSIEDKITRFSDKPQHQTFLEPEGINNESIYLQGISTSLPEDVQYEFLKTIPGLEDVKLIRPGYAVEYDFILPTQIWHSLETRMIRSLYFAGQINGTSGYEEAAAQGLMAGINASLKILEKDPLILRRDQAYIGVLIDDLVTKGTKEPYRMMTSRAEFRLELREDNSLDRLFKAAQSTMSMDDHGQALVQSILTSREKLRGSLKSTTVQPTKELLATLKRLGSQKLAKPVSLEVLLRRAELNIRNFSHFGIDVDYDDIVLSPVEISIKYEGYIKRQNQLIKQAKRLEELRLSPDMPYDQIKGLSREEVEKLSQIKPINLGHAQRISGVNPSAIQALLVFLKGKNRQFEEMERELP